MLAQIGHFNLPVIFAPHHTAWGLEQTMRTIPTHNLLRYASRTFDLVTVFAVEKLFRGV